MFRYFDAHSHIHEKEYDSDRKEVIARMREEGVGTITVGTHIESSKKAVALAESEDIVFAAVGLHPTDTKEDFNPDDYRELVKSKRVIAIGECGLDYFRLPAQAGLNGESQDEKERQRKNFLAQLQFAIDLNKPLMIHCRPSGKTMDAHEDIIGLLKEARELHGERLRGNIHFFTGTPEIANRYFKLGFTISLPGVITFTSEYDDLIQKVPIDRILSETDAPYASPVPYRGKRNEPIFVKETVARIAQIKDMDEKDLGRIFTENTFKIFSIGSR